MKMDSDVVAEYLPFIRIYKDGHVERLLGTEIIPPSLDETKDVVSKDVVFSPDHNLSVRLFLPRKSTATAAGSKKNKLPLLIYIHGGAWIIYSPFSPTYHNYITDVAKSANFLAASVQYRLAPEHPVPAPYEDSWSAVQWIFSHSDGRGPEEWINDHADFGRVFLAGDSAGANMTHHMAMRAGMENKLDRPKIKGIAVVHPAFWGAEPVDELDVQDSETRRGVGELWEKLVSPSSVDGMDDPLFNVVGSDSDLSGLGCEKVLVAVAGKDVFAREGLAYAAKVKKSGWGGEVEVVVSEGEGHVFHLQNPDSESALKLFERVVKFITTG